MSKIPTSFGWPERLFTLFVLACLAALTWPGYAWLGNRIEPRVMGLPFSLAWVVGWVVATFVAMLCYHLSVKRRS